MTERKPAGVSFESWIEAQIRDARERGEFDNLAGHGKPLADITGDEDAMWWIRNWLKRENLSFTPPAIALRKAAEDLLASLARFPTERGLRTALDELNTQVLEMNRTPVLTGPPSNMMPLDVEPIVARWREQRLAETEVTATDPAPAELPRPSRRGARARVFGWRRR